MQLTGNNRRELLGMTTDYVINTNIFILLFNNQLDEAIPQERLGFSVITEIELRLKTPDAIVAASALVADAVLITNDQQLLGLDGIKTSALKMK